MFLVYLPLNNITMKYLPFTLTLLLFVSCSKDDNIDYIELNDQQIRVYLEDNDLQAQSSVSGLYYIIDEEGEGEQPDENSDVTVVYKDYFLDGTVFDQSSTEGASFNLQEVIQGWTEGITYFSGMLLVPAHLAYGNRGVGTIPGGSVLLFDIELVSVN